MSPELGSASALVRPGKVAGPGDTFEVVNTISLFALSEIPGKYRVGDGLGILLVLEGISPGFFNREVENVGN